jgi:uncharacterized protein (DUF983 family)
MNAAQTHFVAVCPHCSTGLKIRRVYLGQRVVCKQCSQSFMGEEREGPSTMAFGEGEAGARVPASPQEDRIIATCPTCRATLRVRRRYIGNNVICKECERTFLVSPPVDAPSNPVAESPRRAEHDRILAAHRELQAEHGRLAGLLAQRDMDLDAARADPDRPGLERERALVEVQRLREVHAERERAIQDEGHLLRAEAERLRLEEGRMRAEIADLHRAFVRAEQAHGEELSRRDDQIREAREHAKDAEDVRAQRDQLRAECDRLRSGVEDLRRTLEEDQRTDRQELARVEAELVGLAGRNRELEDLYESARQLCADYQDRNQGLIGELARLRSEATARTYAERTQATERTELPREALTGLWEIADFADPSAPQPTTSAASAHELQAVRIEVDDLKRRLTDSERLQREMAGILAGMGIRFRSV